MKFKDKIVVVTGGAGGIGSAIACDFAKEGARVIIIDKNEDKCNATASEICSKGYSANYICADVSSRPEAETAFAFVSDSFGPVDILVTATAILEKRSIAETSMEDFDRTMDANIHSVMNAFQAVIPGMKEKGNGNVIIISSMASFLGRAEQTAYAAAEGTLTGMTRNAAVRLGQFGIRVNSIAPGIIDTDFPESLKDDPDYLEFRTKFTPLQRVGKPEDVSGAALFLAGDEAAFITGETIVIDGGLSIHMNGYGL